MADDNNALNDQGTGSGAAGQGAGNADSGAGTDAGSKEPTVDQLKAQLKEANTKLQDATEKHDSLKKIVGDQGNKLGILKQLNELKRSNPQALIEAIAKDADMKVTFGEPPKNDDGDDTTGKVALAQMEDSIMGKIRPVLSTMQEETLSRKFSDWDAGAEERAGVKALHMSGKVSDEELYHLARYGFALPKIIADAEKRGGEKKIDELRKKGAEQVDLGGGEESGKGDYDWETLLKDLTAKNIR